MLSNREILSGLVCAHAGCYVQGLILKAQALFGEFSPSGHFDKEMKMKPDYTPPIFKTEYAQTLFNVGLSMMTEAFIIDFSHPD